MTPHYFDVHSRRMINARADGQFFLKFAHKLADAARAETYPRWVKGCAFENKGIFDFDPVTEADKEAEQAMRNLLQTEFPTHGIAGEEFENQDARSRFSWSLDPVDGTRSFICRLPTWVTLIALLEHGTPVLGLIDAPCLNERYVGFGDIASFQSDGAETRLATSGCTRLKEARLSTTDPFLFEADHSARFERVREQVRTTRYGHDGYAYARLAAGSLDLVIEAGLKPYDYNALIPVVRAGGGVISDWKGGEDFAEGRVIAAATPGLLAEAIETMRD